MIEAANEVASINREVSASRDVCRATIHSDDHGRGPNHNGARDRRA